MTSSLFAFEIASGQPLPISGGSRRVGLFRQSTRLWPLERRLGIGGEARLLCAGLSSTPISLETTLKRKVHLLTFVMWLQLCKF